MIGRLLIDECLSPELHRQGLASRSSVAVARARELLGREINPTVYAPAEFAKKLAAKDHFLAQVLARPKLNVLGNEDELAKATGK